MGGQAVDVAAAGQLPRRPVEETGHAMSPLVGGTLAAAHPGIVAAHQLAVVAARVGERRPARRPVVREEDQQRIVGEAEFVEPPPQATDVVVDVGDHPVECRQFGVPAHLRGVRLAPLVGDAVRAVRGVRRQLDEERTVAMGLDEPRRLAEEHVRAITRELLRPAVAGIGVVEVVVAPVIGDLPDSPAAVDERLLEPAIPRPEGEVVAQVPLAENRRRVTVLREHLGHHPLVRSRHVSSHDGMPHARPGRIAAGHRAPRVSGSTWGRRGSWRAGRSRDTAGRDAASSRRGFPCSPGRRIPGRP